MTNLLTKRILLVRHGECVMNLDLATRIGGQSNESPLTLLGIKQVRTYHCIHEAFMSRCMRSDGSIAVVLWCCGLD